MSNTEFNKHLQPGFGIFRGPLFTVLSSSFCLLRVANRDFLEINITYGGRFGHEAQADVTPFQTLTRITQLDIRVIEDSDSKLIILSTSPFSRAEIM